MWADFRDADSLAMDFRTFPLYAFLEAGSCAGAMSGEVTRRTKRGAETNGQGAKICFCERAGSCPCRNHPHAVASGVAAVVFKDAEGERRYVTEDEWAAGVSEFASFALDQHLAGFGLRGQSTRKPTGGGCGV